MSGSGAGSLWACGAAGPSQGLVSPLAHSGPLPDPNGWLNNPGKNLLLF